MANRPLLTRPQPLECRECGSVQHLPALSPGARAACAVCDAPLRHARKDPLGIPLALNAAGLVMFAIGAFWSLLSISTAGQTHSATLWSGPNALERTGLWELSAVILATTIAIPLLRILCMIAILAGSRSRHRVPGLRTLFGWAEHLRPWSMVEIFLLGLFVAYVRLRGIAHIELGAAIFALAGFSAALFGADRLLDRLAVWEALDSTAAPARPPAPAAQMPRHALAAAESPLPQIGCDTCGLVMRGRDGMVCPRCGFTLHHRKPHSLARASALLLAAAVLYIPANVYPILTVIHFGAGQPSTILEGVEELIDAEMWPLAALVFFASIVVPVLKLAGLTALLAMTMSRTGWRLRDRNLLYRVVDSIGRWSMIDIFMESILVALVQFGAVITIIPGVGAIAFASVVILTMLAAESFDPRLAWDRALRPQSA